MKFCAALSNTDAQTIEKFSQSLNFFLSKCFSPKILHNMTKPDYEKKEQKNSDVCWGVHGCTSQKRLGTKNLL